MTAAIPPQMEGTHAPNAVELLWEKYRGLFRLLVIVLIASLGLNYGWAYYQRVQRDQEYSAFAATTGLANGYSNSSLPASLEQQRLQQAYMQLPGDLAKEVVKLDDAALEQAIQKADAARKPYLIWVSAARAVETQQWDKAEAALSRLESEYPKHILCIATDYPVQVRPEVKKDEAQDAAKKPNQKPELEPAKAGSLVGMLRAQIASHKTFQMPAQFRQPPIPENAPKVKVKLSGGWGEFTIALLPDVAPKHVAKFLELVDAKFFDGIKVDEIHRDGTRTKFYDPEFHFGFEKTKTTDDRTQWSDANPSPNQVDWESSELSHFPGAIAARAEGDKSSPDRIWVCVDDLAKMDGNRVIFGFVVEGLDKIRGVTDAPFSTSQEEEMGSGKPADNIVIESVTKL